MANIILSNSAEDTEKIGEQMGKKLNPGDVVALYGELGVGKTVLVKGIAKGLGCSAMVKSPSFVYMHEYSGRVPIFHIDLYRVSTTTDIITLGIDEVLKNSDSICLVEWAERAKGLLPERKVISVEIKILNENSREITIKQFEVKPLQNESIGN
ncbi:MAG: tRNA (adenosine(37)-N6)-threonylcarbamoyltransferase complex ATPase subunit type 1 TsaE [Candidatus Stahlbacteria bacterium]|nr:tRNA (adenosine(37)-N6)-threonylcarbamoyltransferase complex ATPase subunit type 1 TsaE [Candidatus Stahlbacteria bacterium]